MTRYIRAAGVSETAVDDELFLVAPQTQEIVHLDALAAAVWRQLAEPATAADIAALFAAAFPDMPAERLRADIEAALAVLLAEGLAAAA
jgi:hypothetical protein